MTGAAENPVPLAQFKNVTKAYGKTVVVEELNLDVGTGEFLAIMGPSGCGKTTTLRMLAGLEDVTSGDLTIEGVSTLDLAPYERDTPMVWQSLALFPFMTVEQNVEFGLKMRGIAKAERKVRVARWLDRMEIGQFAKRNVSTLSGGQRQRVALARSLVTEPKLLLLDEPLSALDANLVLRMQSVLTNLQRDLGITFVYVTHSQSEAFAMADRVIIMNEGKICQVGSPKEIYREPANRFVAEFVGLNNLLTGQIESAEAGVLRVKTPTGVFAVDQPEGLTRLVGEEITFVIAADNLRPVGDNVSVENQTLCTVVSEEFVGATVIVLLEQDNGDEVKIQLTQREFETAELAPGKQVRLTWSPADTHVLRRPTSNTDH